MRSRVPKGLRLAFLAGPQHRASLPLAGQWADVRFFDTSRGWALAGTEAALFRPDVSFFIFDEAFEPASTAGLPGTKVGMVVRPPHGAGGPWPLDTWRTSVDLVTWFEPPPTSEPGPLAIIPLPVDRSGLQPPDFKRRSLVVPRWAAPPHDVLERLAKLEDLVVLEPQGRLEDHLKLIASAGLFLAATYDAIGRLDPLPLQALARGLLVVTTTAFPPLWGIEPEDDYLVRPEARLLEAVDECSRIPDTTRAVRLRAFQKTAELFDADEVFQRLTVDVLLAVDAGRLATSPKATLRRVK